LLSWTGNSALAVRNRAEKITGDQGEEDAYDRGRLKEAFIEVLT
jgi:hypothetical protein